MSQEVRYNQFKIRVNGVDYENCYFQAGVQTIPVASSDAVDWTATTNKLKFPNNLLVWGVRPEWVNVTWDTILRGATVYQGATYIMLSGNHRSASAQNVELGWWAIGN